MSLAMPDPVDSLGYRHGAAVRPLPRRSDWVDVAKGLGIVLVALGHVIGGLRDAGLLAADSVWRTVFFDIYIFHMPLFFFISGLFVEKRVAAPPRVFIESLLRRVAWPYLLWSAIQISVIQALGGLVNVPTPFAAENYYSLVWRTTGQFWYLHALAALLLMSFLVIPRFGGKALVGLALVGLALAEWLDPPGTLGMISRYGIYFALGVLLGPKLSRLQVAEARLGVVALLALAAFFLGAEAARHLGLAYGSPPCLPVAIDGCIAVLALAQLPAVASQRSLQALGRLSLPIFLMHVLFAAGSRILLHKGLGISDTAILLPMGFGAAVLGPLFVHRLASRMRLVNALGLA